MPTPTIRFTAKLDKIIEVILCLAHKGIELDRYKIVKLVYLADVAHLNRYGRPITYDTMVAMKNGPVPTTLYDILKRNRRYKIDYDTLPFDYIARGDRHYIENPKRAINRKLFSKSDLAILDEIAASHGNKTFRELYDMTHQHPGYQRAWAAKGNKHSHPIRFEDLLDESELKPALVEEMRLTCRHVL